MSDDIAGLIKIIREVVKPDASSRELNQTLVNLLDVLEKNEDPAKKEEHARLMREALVAAIQAIPQPQINVLPAPVVLPPEPPEEPEEPARPRVLQVTFNRMGRSGTGPIESLTIVEMAPAED